MNFIQVSLGSLQWNTLRLPATSAIFLGSFPKITTELQLLTPRLDLEPFCNQAVQVKNSFASSIAQLMPELHLSTLEAEGISNQGVRPVLIKVNTMPQASIADLMSEYLVGIAESQLPEQLPQGETVALQQAISDRLQVWGLTNHLNPLPLILNSLPEALSLPKPQEQIQRIQLFLEELSREIQKRKEHVEDRLLRIVERLSDSIARLTTPPPRLARQAVRTSGPRTRGPVRARGEPAKAYISGVILDEAWKPEQTLRLPVEKGPVIAAGHLILTVRGEGASLVGRRADLVFISEWIEVGLGSAEIRKPKGYQQWELDFDVDLESAGLKVRDGTLPLQVLQVIIEPAPKTSKRRGRKASR
jgi:hypothetical protein